MKPPSAQPPNTPQYDPQVLLNSQPVMITVIEPRIIQSAVPKSCLHQHIRRHVESDLLREHPRLRDPSVRFARCQKPLTRAHPQPARSRCRTTNICWSTG